MKPAIELSKISKFYGQNQALCDVSLSIYPGGFYILLGKNGAGKSTLMRLLMRYEPPDSGLGTVLGRPLESESDNFNLEIGYVSEAIDYVLPLRMNKLFKYFAEIYPNWDQKLFEGVLSELRIDLDKYFRELSRGQKMQVAFAAAIAIRPKILLLDEITAVLDANARAFFMDYLGKFTREGGTVVMATNIVSEVQNHANHVVLLSGGRISLDAPFAELPSRFVKIRRQPGERDPIFDREECVEVSLNSDGSTSHIATIEFAKANGLRDSMVDQRSITAEDIFIFFTRTKAR